MAYEEEYQYAVQQAREANKPSDAFSQTPPVTPTYTATDLERQQQVGLTNIPPQSRIEPEIPKSAIVTERSGAGKPTVLTADGIDYYTPESTPYKLGWRTRQDFQKNSAGGMKSYGVYEGSLIPDDTIILLNKQGKAIDRYRISDIGVGEGFRIDPSAIEPFVKENRVLYPVQSQYGEKLLNKKQINALESAGTDAALLKLYKDYGLVSNRMTLEQFRMTPEQSKKAVAAESFGRQQDIKRAASQQAAYEKQLKEFESKLRREFPEGYRVYKRDGYDAYEKFARNKQRVYDEWLFATNFSLKNYTDENGLVDGAKYLRDNPKDTKTLAQARFSSQQIKEWQKYNTANLFPAYQQSVKERRNDLLKSNKPMTGESPEQFYIRMDGKARAELLEGYTLAEKERIMRSQVVDLEGYVIPYMHTGANWATMTTPEKVLSIGIETAAILAMVYGGRVAGSVAKQIRGASKVEKLAATAGKAAKELESANKSLLKTTAKPKADSTAQRLAQTAAVDRAETAQRASMKADRLFLEQLEKIDAISPKDLKKLEKLSGIKGFKDSITNVSKARNAVSKAWDDVEKLQRLASKTGFKYDAVEYQKALSRLQKAQANLETALLKADSNLQVRFKYGPSAPEFKGYKVNIKKAKLDLQGIQDEIDTYLARKGKPIDKSGGKPQTQVIEKTKIIQKADVELKPMYKSPAVKPVEPVKVPLLKTDPVKAKPSVLPGIKTRQKEAVTYKPSEKTGERFWTQKQRDDAYRELSSEVGEYRAKYLTDELDKLQRLGQIDLSSKEWISVKDALEAALKKSNELAPSDITKSNLKDALSEEVKDSLGEKSNTMTDAEVKAVLKVITETAVIQKTPAKETVKPPIQEKPKMPLRLPDQDASDKEKRDFVKNNPPLVVQNMGKLRGKDVWHVFYPNGKRLVILGSAPEGTRVTADGKGSAEKTTQTIGKGTFKPIIKKHGAVTTVIRPSKAPKGATAQFTSRKVGKMFKTRIGDNVGLSRRPIGKVKK